MRAARRSSSAANASGSASRAQPRPPRPGRLATASRLGELPRARLALVQKAEARVPAALAQTGQQRQQMRLRAGDARDLPDVEDVPLTGSPSDHDCVRPRLDGVVAHDPLAQLAARSPRGRARRSPRSARRARRRPRGESAARSGRNAVEDRVRGEHRQARRGGLVDDLVRRAGTHVVDERVGAGEQLRHVARAGRARRA